MAKVELIMPKMGESIMEATILKWNKKVGDKIEMDETILEIATDKVDSEIPSPVEGVLTEILFPEDSVVEIGKVIAILSTEGDEDMPKASPAVAEQKSTPSPTMSEIVIQKEVPHTPAPATAKVQTISAFHDDRFYSPLVKNIAKEEGINDNELAGVMGTGANGRVTKKDILEYLKNRSGSGASISEPSVAKSSSNGTSVSQNTVSSSSLSGDSEIIQMDRMRKIIADHMVMSKQTSPHVTSFVEADVTNLFNWRGKVKNSFEKSYGERITFTPIFIEAVVKAIKDFPMINISVDGDKILVKKNINIGMATALPSGNLIVPVIKNADRLNLAGLTAAVNGLALKARNNKLKPEDIQDGSFTITNVGTFGNVMGTPIINQPQVAILAVGAIRKKPAVLETVYGDVIAIRQMMFLSLSYDHRVVDGFLGGSFLRKIADYLESFDPERDI